MSIQQRNKLFYWIFKIVGILISCAFPIWAICEKYPIWKTAHGTSRSIGAGGILILIVVLIVFRRTVFKFLTDRCKLKHAPPLAIWIVLLICAYILMFIGSLMRDFTTVLWMGLIGCAIGTLLTFIAENAFGQKKLKEKEKEDE